MSLYSFLFRWGSFSFLIHPYPSNQNIGLGWLQPTKMGLVIPCQWEPSTMATHVKSTLFFFSNTLGSWKSCFDTEYSEIRYSKKYILKISTRKFYIWNVLKTCLDKINVIQINLVWLYAMIVPCGHKGHLFGRPKDTSLCWTTGTLKRQT